MHLRNRPGGLPHQRFQDKFKPCQKSRLKEKFPPFLDDVAALGQAVIILTGGEPLLREDIYELTAHGHQLGHRMVMAVNGTLLTPEIARRLKEAGIQRVSISLDGAASWPFILGLRPTMCLCWCPPAGVPRWWMNCYRRRNMRRF